MDKFFVGVEHSYMHGVSVAYLIDELRPTKVCVEALSGEEAKKHFAVAPIYEKCGLEGIPFVAIDKELSRIEGLKCVVFVVLSQIQAVCIDLLSVLFRLTPLTMWRMKLSCSKKIPFSSLIDDEREAHMVKRINEEDFGEGTMLVIVGLGHVDALKKHFN